MPTTAEYFNHKTYNGLSVGNNDGAATIIEGTAGIFHANSLIFLKQ